MGEAINITFRVVKVVANHLAECEDKASYSSKFSNVSPKDGATVSKKETAAFKLRMNNNGE